MHSTSSFELKLSATKILIVCALHLRHFFDPLPSTTVRVDMENIFLRLTNIWHRFLDLTEVRSSIRDELSTGGSFLSSVFRMAGGSRRRRMILQELGMVKNSIDEVSRQKELNYITYRHADLTKQLLQIFPYPFAQLGKHEKPEAVKALIVSEDGNRLYSGSNDCKIGVWDISGAAPPSAPLAMLQGHYLYHYVYALAVGNGRLYSGSVCAIGVWDISGDAPPLAPLAMLQGINVGTVVLTLAESNERLYSGSQEDNTIQVWNISRKELPSDPLAMLQGHMNCVYALIVSNGRLYSGSVDKTIGVWDISSAKPPSGPLAMLEGHSKGVTVLAACNGRLYSGSWDKMIGVWDISGAALSSAPLAMLRGHSDTVYALAVRDDRLYSASKDDTIGVWDISGSTPSLTPIAILKEHRDVVHALALCNGRLYSGLGHGGLIGIYYV